jgi:DNA-binding NarL/FixJ family response regulator
MLERILIIDATGDVEHLIRFCVHPYWPEIILETYDPRTGIPEYNFNWHRYDLLLLDYDLAIPDENGLDWLRELKQNPYLPPTIMLSGYASEKLSNAVKKFGADGYLEKDNLSPQYFAQTIKQIFVASQNNEAQVHKEDYLSENTEFLSPQERHEIMSRINGDAIDPGMENEEYDKTILMNHDEMIGIVNRERYSTITEHEQASSTDLTNKTINGATTTADRINSLKTAKTKKKVDQPLVIPGYIVKKKIGEGGMASIYLAEREEDRLTVVLKILKLEGDKDSSLLIRFMREYKLIAQINHPNIVQIYERAFASNFAYIAMEYFPYGDLKERLQKRLDPKTALSYLKQIAVGLGAAHDKGIVHRDMKPANMLFRTKDILAITDFGIAKIVDIDNQVKKELTMDGSLMGTLYYISPEQIEGAEADQRSDIYSLGIIMYKMLTGRHPFDGTTPYEVFEGHLWAPIPELPKDFAILQPLLNGLLAKDPDERFQSTDELVMGIDWK